jgi:hypothetical protein
MQWLRSLVQAAPRQAMIVGKGLFLAGSILVLAAVFGRAGAASAIPAALAWMVPESPVGFIVAALLVLVGMTLILLAEKAGKGRR